MTARKRKSKVKKSVETTSTGSAALNELIEEKKEVVKQIHVLEDEVEEIDEKIEEVSEKREQEKKKMNGEKSLGVHFYEKRRFVLFIGILIGGLIAAYVHIDKIPNDILSPFDDLLNLDSLSLDKMSFDTVDWSNYLPEGLMQTLQSRQDEEKKESGDFAIGKEMKKKGYEAKFNVIMVPGVVSTGIESWGLEGIDGCPSQQYFRKRLWGSFFMLRTMLMDKVCWLKHIMLDGETGLDPPGVKLRAAQGFEAADFFVTGYWIWNKVLENLAVIGYGPDNMYSAAYDWRLAYIDLERRDGYFSKLKSQIELSNKLNKKKTVLMGHSMGSQIIFFFFKWVEAEGEGFGNGGKSWVNDNIEAFVDISGSMLGTPKAITALLSGEMRDTVDLNALAVYGLEKFFSRRERADMLKSFGGIPSMIPKGGDLIWGDFNSALDDQFNSNNASDVSESSLNDTFGNFIRFRDPIGNYSSKNLTVSESIDFLLDQGPEWFKRRTRENYSFGYARSRKELEENENSGEFNKWSNPLEVPLPNAPDMKVYCFYGVGKPTERAYFYKEVVEKNNTGLNVTIDMDTRDNAVLMSDGDGTVSLLTHAMCHRWAEEGDNPYNPGGSKVTIVEIRHEPDSFDIRGGSRTAEHVDILGSARLNELLLAVAAGDGSTIASEYITSLRETVAALNLVT